MSRYFPGLFLLCISFLPTEARTLYAGKAQPYRTIRAALRAARNGDTVEVAPGFYREGNLLIDKRICLLGKGRPVLDGAYRYEILSIKADGALVSGFRVQHSGQGTLDDPGGIKVYDAKDVVIEHNELIDNFFGIYIQYGTRCVIRNNDIRASRREEYRSGNGIHCWKSDSLQVTGNRISGHRDGIYFEFVTHSIIWRNVSQYNLRYGLHFMFSHHDAYITNCFRANGAGVAVMFTKDVVMMNNTFEDNWGDAAYGLLFKEISDCYLSGNRFLRNTTGVFFDGSNRIRMERNLLKANGWGLRLQASCMDNFLTQNNFIGNTFDVATNGTLTLNRFHENYWDKYEGYDLNRDAVGDVPYHPLSLFSVIAEKTPPAMLLYRSFMITLLDKSEKLLPSLTPQTFADLRPRMKPFAL